MEQFELYSYQTTDITIKIDVKLDSTITIFGYESGNIVNKINGGSDYEYYLTINKFGTIQLKVLKLIQSNRKLKQFFLEEFSGLDCIEKIKKFCAKNFIKYNFSVWR